MRSVLLMASIVLLAACSSPDLPADFAHGADVGRAVGHDTALRSPDAARQPRAIAGLPDNGSLVAYTQQTTVKQATHTWHPVRISEAHALRAIATGRMTFQAPDGTPIELEYDRHVEHPDGNWTWVGRPAGAQPGTEAIITFGEKAVFGTIPNRGRKPLRIGSSHGHAWVVETDEKRLQQMVDMQAPQGPDFVLPPALAGARDTAIAMAAAKPQQLTAEGAVPESATVDLVIGYTNGFAQSLGSSSAAVTRLTYMTEVTNQALENSQVVARVRLVGTLAVNYSDTTDDYDALEDLTGVRCSSDGSSCPAAPVSAGLVPLINLRTSKQADLVSLVRNFVDSSITGCGIAWMLGGGMVGEISQAEVRAWGVSVVADGWVEVAPGQFRGCHDQTLAHELGHNFGSQHDAETADSDGDGIEDGERGVFRYSMGYRTDSFYTVMAYGQGTRQDYLVFSNPRIDFCGGNFCGIAEEADNARSIGQTVSVLASARQTLAGNRPRSDFNGDGRSDLVWRNTQSGANAIWLSANSATPRAVTGVPNLGWTIAGTGDFNGDRTSDLLWRNASSGQNAIWYSGLSQSAVTLASTPSTWSVAGIGDFNGDDRDDILWRKPSTGANAIWLSGNHLTPQAMTSVYGTAWAIVGVGDVDGDGYDDVLWRNTSGANALWRSANSGTQLVIEPVYNQAWKVVGVGDFDLDGYADFLWRNTSNGGNAVWWSGNAVNSQGLQLLAPSWAVASVGDYNGDGAADIFWRNQSTLDSMIWRSATASTQQAVTRVGNHAWIVVR